MRLVRAGSNPAPLFFRMFAANLSAIKYKHKMKDLKGNPMPSGVVLNMPESEYHAIPAFSKSLAKKARISPVDAWETLYGEPSPPSADMIYGSAMHCLALEGREEFANRYCRPFDRSNYPEAVDTVAEIKAYLAEKGVPVKSTWTRGQLVELLAQIDPGKPLVEELKAWHANNGKQQISAEHWEEITSREWIGKRPEFINATKEVSLFWFDEQFRLPCKARIDAVQHWEKSGTTVVADLKTFTNRNQKPIGDCVRMEIASRAYHLDAWFYVRALRHAAPEMLGETVRFDLVFLEKGRTFPNVLTRTIETGGELGQVANGTFQRMANMIRENIADRGDKPWNHKTDHAFIDAHDLPLSML